MLLTIAVRARHLYWVIMVFVYYQVIHGAGTVYCAFTFFEIISNRSDLIGRGGRSTVLSTMLTAMVYLVVMLGVGGALSLLDLQVRPGSNLMVKN